MCTLTAERATEIRKRGGGIDNVQIIYRQSCKFPRRCALGDAVDRGAASRSIQAQQIWNYANEEWDLYQPFVQAKMHAICEPMCDTARAAFPI